MKLKNFFPNLLGEKKFTLFGWAALARLMTVAQDQLVTIVTQSYCSYSAKSATSPATPLQLNKLFLP